MEDYDTFYQKELLPKELRNINPNLLKLIPRWTSSNFGIPDNKNFEVKRDVTEEEKKLINIKYSIKRLNTIHNKEMLSFKKLKSKIGTNKSPKKKFKTFASEMNIGKMNDLDEATNWDSATKGSQSPKKNERYSKVITNDDEIDDLKMLQFQKALSMPLNITQTFDSKIATPDKSPIDKFLSGMIDEIEEDTKSVDEDSSDEDISPSISKKWIEIKRSQRVSDKKWK